MRLTLLLLLLAAVFAQADTQTDIEYARVGDTALLLDLHTPSGVKQPPLIVYVHGGAWRAGSKSDVPIAGLLDHGFAIASVDYRLSTQARFPAQIHDIKAAIRFLRAKASSFGINTEKIAIIGSSAGGHLAALTGVTNGHHELEGRVGDHLDQSSDVSAIVSFYGASNLESILGQSTEFGLTVRIPALKLLLGDLPEKVPSREARQSRRASRQARSAATAPAWRCRSPDAACAVRRVSEGLSVEGAPDHPARLETWRRGILRRGASPDRRGVFALKGTSWHSCAMTALLLDPIYQQHDPGPGHPESIQRHVAITKALNAAGHVEKAMHVTPRAASLDELTLCHTRKYIEKAKDDVESGLDDLSTGDTSICAKSYDVAVQAVGGVLNAVDAVFTGKAANAFCAVRPPGHHARPAQGMGFCLFNNIAIAARHAQKMHGAQKAAIIDWDVHHGNGTQDIFMRMAACSSSARIRARCIHSPVTRMKQAPARAKAAR